MRPIHLWWEYVAISQMMGFPSAAFNTFEKYRKAVFGAFLRFRMKNEFAKCDNCVKMNHDMRVARTVEARHSAALAKSDHTVSQWMDRQVYWRLRDMSLSWFHNITRSLYLGVALAVAYVSSS